MAPAVSAAPLPSVGSLGRKEEQKLARSPKVVVGEVALQQREAARGRVVHERQSRRDLDLGDPLLWYVEEMHQQAPDGVLRRGDQHALPLGDRVPLDRVDPVRDGAVHAVLQRLTPRQLAVDAHPPALERSDQSLPQRHAHVADVTHVPWVVARVMLGERRHRGGWCVVRTAP
eukprot:CAMPEP_0195573470 /NCGR_PEP_ID=MMETSP0814-20130614/5358_1 /TAXON_ID=97485 /ORGANISM="Prymnesium parvum, Strain Texoma1" /LENGTH=172 /DNA_ID=CAMNT_0040709355 /DNA_START=473 /DNA_END=993 /DNA_ORIENTATION=-